MAKQYKKVLVYSCFTVEVPKYWCQIEGYFNWKWFHCFL